MYDVTFGGKRMTKRLTIALIALVALVLVAVLPVSATYYNINNTIIKAGATVYIGEQQLNLIPAGITAGTQVGWWASAATITSTSPSQTLTITNPGSFYASPATFGSYPGNWYLLVNGVAGPVAFNAQDPSISVDVWDLSTATTVTSGTAIQGDYLAIRVNSNLDQALNGNYRAKSAGDNTGNVDLKVKSASGNTYNALYANTTDFTTVSITKQIVNQPSWFWGTSDGNVPASNNYAPNWSTGAMLPSGQNAYPAGVYTVIAQSRLNGMYDNYLNGGATYTGKTISQPATVTIASNTVAIAANVDSVVRSKPFSVTVTGKPNMVYHLWLKGTSTMDGTYNNQPPYITPNQVGVTSDSVTISSAPAANVPYNPLADNGAYVYQNGVPIWNNVAHGDDMSSAGPDSQAIGNGTFLYANVTLDQTGTRTVQFSTTNWTKAQQYTVRVEQDFGTSSNHNYKYDEVNVQVQKGAVTIVAAGSQSYYLGEEVQFSGTNTESTTTYLFITGPNLPTQGTSIASSDPRNYVDSASTGTKGVIDGSVNGFQQVSVNGDNTWSWEWGTSAVALDAGTYTVYAVSGPEDANSLQDVAYGTVSIIVKAPFVSATASQSTVAQGDPVYITGTAQGQPTLGVNIWILGKNFADLENEAVNSDSSFSYELMGTTTQNMASGQYFIVVQHPMENGQFDVTTNVAPQRTTASTVSYVYTTSPQTPGVINLNATQDFALTGSGSLQGSNAAEALVEAINSANVDDTYTKLQMLIETPVITINPISDHSVGDKFSITASTNLAVGDNVLFTVYSSSFQPTSKTQSGEFSGASGTVQVTQGTNGLNALSFSVDASTFKPDEYLVTATEQGVSTSVQATGTALFNVLQAAAPTATPTVVAATTTVAPTQMPTAVPTTVAPTKTPTQPGFGALVALIGLGAVALLVVRRH
jgi:PGF-CTERM protein